MSSLQTMIMPPAPHTLGEPSMPRRAKRRRAAPEPLVGSEGWASIYSVDERASKRSRPPSSKRAGPETRSATKVVEPAPPAKGKVRKLLWIANGVSVIPFLVLLRALGSGGGKEKEWDIQLMIAAGADEGDTLLSCAAETLANTPSNIRLSVEVFYEGGRRSIKPCPPSASSVHRHRGAITATTLDCIPDLTEREVYLCGHDAFEVRTWDELRSAGVCPSRIRRDGFEY
ncbi:uncharacterized protein SCHCODRAFT_02011569 [Schizophyllum commune H4-8]|uniref:uncharacterized protein n=1 Tax=Schizophyllum commune (strain H4-8 / FGSC 9210) TaxID=578458 RepID=UPI00215F18AD|nr:uncharacterized protein SCHCODRAFT_02011569 [Schizophyllum commune H4-8]KAI5899441.1 hypothetical protein SCHCODRAFT_02011569 [Schizophyllum commune H4-8]